MRNRLIITHTHDANRESFSGQLALPPIQNGLHASISSHTKSRQWITTPSVRRSTRYNPSSRRTVRPIIISYSSHSGYLTPTLGHRYVDILKVDVEGAEFTALESFIKAYKDKNLPLPFGQLLIELHVWGEWDNFEKFLGWWEMLEDAGLRPFWTEVSRTSIPPTCLFSNKSKSGT